MPPKKSNINVEKKVKKIVNTTNYDVLQSIVEDSDNNVKPISSNGLAKKVNFDLNKLAEDNDYMSSVYNYYDEYRELFYQTYKLFEFRDKKTNIKYDYENMLQSLETTIDTGEKFKKAILHPKYSNPLGEEIVRLILHYKQIIKITSFNDIFYFNMSFLIKNLTFDTYTAVIFIPTPVGKSSQVPTHIIRMIFGVLYTLKPVLSHNITELILIYKGKFHSECIKMFFKIKDVIYIQKINKIDILSPPVYNVNVPKYEIIGPKEVPAFLKKNQLSNNKMKKIILQKDEPLQYYGVRPGSIVKIKRPIFLTESLAKEQTYAYIR